MKHVNDGGLPIRIKTYFDLKEPNEPIPIYSGAGVITGEGLEIPIDNLTISFDWLPRIGANFELVLLNFRGLKTFERFMENNSSVLVIDGQEIGTLHITSFSVRGPVYVNGFLQFGSKFGDTSIVCPSVSFLLMNFNYVFGAAIRDRGPDDGESFSRSRISLIDSKYQILLDSVQKSHVANDAIRMSGGFVKTNDGEVSRLDNRGVSYKETGKLLDQLSTFLSFLNGRRVGPVLPSGVSEGEVRWTDLSPRLTSSGSTPRLWRNNFKASEIEAMWPNFRTLCSDPGDWDAIDTVIHWYIEANSNAGLIEGATIMTQTALELLYNFIVVEKKKAIIGKESESISAANKIRLLLALLDIKGLSDFTNCSKLDSYIKSSKELKDVIESIVQIRNSIVHSQKSKREGLSKISLEVKIEAVKVGLLIVECALLKLFGFSGKFRSRIKSKILFD